MKDGKLASDLFDKQAKQAAEAVAACRREENKSTQLRRFYDELVMWLERVEQSPDRFASYLPMIRMLKAKAAYARGRKLVDEKFEQLLGQIVDHATDPVRLRQSKLFFEAFLGFYKLEKGD
ncbi:MAG: type III-A CRISPR-associated protein Csm2 [Gammaproteobacteria bacterium]|nr:MAG: type III-A CRISPR-associated protein Csm2 [Gammaproteobacteria bacterium]